MLTNAKAGGIRCNEILYIENKASVWGQIPQRQKANGVQGRSPRRCGKFTAFLKKKYAFFMHSLSKFCVFKWLNKVLICPQDFCPWHVPPLASPPIATLLGEKAKTVHLLSLLCYSILTLNQINVLT